MRGWRPAVALMLVLGGVQPGVAQQAGGPGGNPGAGARSGGPGGGVAGTAPSGDTGRPTPGGAGPADAETVRDAVASGRSVPYPRILSAVAAVVQGMVVDVEILPVAAGGLAYGIKVLTPEGALREVVVDARLGTVRSVR